MVALLQQYGPERMIVNSAADWGKSDPLKVPSTAQAMRGPGFSEAEVEQVVWQQPDRVLRAVRGGSTARSSTASRSTRASSSRATRCCAARRRSRSTAE